MRRIPIFLFIVLWATVGRGGVSQNIWEFQNSGVVPESSSEGMALAMQGSTCPYIFSFGKVAIQSPGKWNTLTSPPVNNYIQAARSVNGDFGVAGLNDPQNLSQVGTAFVATSSGWESFSADALTFDGQGRIWKAARDGTVAFRNAGSWNNLPISPANFQNIDLDVAPDGQVGVVTQQGTGGLKYYQYLPSVGWSQRQISPVNFKGSASLSFDFRGIPHIVGVDINKTVMAYDYDIPSNSWRSSVLGTNVLTDYPVLPMVSDGAGTVATAFVTGSGSDAKVQYARKTGNNLWETITLPRPVDSYGNPLNTISCNIGLDFDYVQLPVIAFQSETGQGPSTMWIAYDPILTPEPVSAMLLVSGSLMLIRRKKL